AQLLVAAIAQWPLDILGMPGLDRLHDSGCLRRREVEPLPVDHAAGPRVRAANHNHRYSRPIETREIGDAGDAEVVCQRPQPGNRLLRRDSAMGPATIGLDATV